jgi:hypothetical protein
MQTQLGRAHAQPPQPASGAANNFLHGQQQLSGYPRGPAPAAGRGQGHFPKHMIHRPFNDLRHSKVNGQQHSPYTGMGGKASYGMPRELPMFDSYPVIYQIHFKLFHAYCCADASTVYNLNEFVFVEADRGETIGIIVAVVPQEEYRSLSALWGIKELKRILRVATVRDRMALPQKSLEEQRAAQLCYDKAVLIYKLPIVLYDAEFQYDRQKLTFLFSSKT